MEKYIIISFLILILPNIGISQAIPDSTKQQILQDLHYDGFLEPKTGEPWIKFFNAMNEVQKYRITDAIPLLEEKLWSSTSILQSLLMSALFRLEDQNIGNIAKAVIDTAEKIISGIPRINEDYFASPEQSIYNANYYLFKLGDFTYADKYIKYIKEKGGIDFDGIVSISMAGELAKASPVYYDYVKSELLRIMNRETLIKGSYRSFIIGKLFEIYEKDVLNELTENFSLTEDSSGTNVGLAERISSLRYPPFESALKEKFVRNGEKWHLDYYAKMLLKYYGTPENYKFLASYITERTDEYEKKQVMDVLSFFTHIWPSELITVNVFLDTLISNTRYAEMFSWLGDQNFVKELDNHLANAKKHLEKADSLNCVREIEKFQSKINKEYKEASDKDGRFVTIEGWKFLYYNAQYIIDRLVSPSQRPSETVLLQIDNLKTELKDQSKKKTIGGTILVKGLNLLIDKAKKELQKSDSTKTALYIGLFQAIVDEAWELTEKLNSKKSSIIFVNDEAYIALYYRAKYILEVLPEPKMNILEQRQQIMEKDPALKDLRKEIDRVK